MVKLGYKNTEIGEIPKEWKLVRIGDSFKFKNGLNKEKEFFGYGYPIVNYMDVFKNTFINSYSLKGKVFVSNNELRSFNVDKGDVLFTRTSETHEEIGLTSVISSNLTKTVFSGFLLRARPYNKLFEVEFCRFCFDNKIVRTQIISKASYTTRALTNGRVLSEVKIPLPPLHEQQSIAEVLSDADMWIENLEELIAKKQLFKNGSMQQLFMPKEDWKVNKLGEIAKVIMGQSPLSKNYNSKGIGLPLVQGNADIKNRKTIIRNYTSQITRKGEAGDIIMSVRAPVGEIAKATFACCLGRGVCSVRYQNEYLYHYLIFKENYWRQVSTGSTFDSVTSIQVSDFEIRMPKSLTEQNRIATILSDMDNEIDNLVNQLNKVRKIKQGMMQELLTGRVRLV